jgi:sigma-70-like protein
MMGITVRRRHQWIALLAHLDAIDPDPGPELTVDEIEAMRPRTREDCRDGVRPCPWSCRHNLAYEITAVGSIKLHAIAEGALACALDAAERGGMTLEETAQALGVTRERARQIEVRALLKLHARPEDLGR